VVYYDIIIFFAVMQRAQNHPPVFLLVLDTCLDNDDLQAIKVVISLVQKLASHAVYSSVKTYVGSVDYCSAGTSTHRYVKQAHCQVL